MNPFRKTVQKPSPLILQQEFSLLSPHHQQTFNKILAKDSIHFDKFSKKVQANDIQLNANMLEKMLDHLHMQYRIPLQSISKEKLKEQLGQEIHIISHLEQEIWFDLLSKLDIWSNFMFHHDEIFYFLALSNSLLIQDKSPHFHVVNLQSKKTIFWNFILSISRLCSFSNFISIFIINFTYYSLFFLLTYYHLILVLTFLLLYYNSNT